MSSLRTYYSGIWYGFASPQEEPFSRSLIGIPTHVSQAYVLCLLVVQALLHKTQERDRPVDFLAEFSNSRYTLGRANTPSRSRGRTETSRTPISEHNFNADTGRLKSSLQHRIQG